MHVALRALASEQPLNSFARPAPPRPPAGGGQYKGPFSTGNEVNVFGWKAVMPVAGPGANEISIDLAPLGGQRPTAVRYAMGGGSCWSCDEPAPGSKSYCTRMCHGIQTDCSKQPCPNRPDASNRLHG